MKVQSILFTLLQTSAAVAAAAADETTTNCETPCRSTNLRMTMAKMEECLKLHCGGGQHDNDAVSPSDDNAEDIIDVDDVDIDLSSPRAGPYRSCISQCKRNRFSHRNIIECKDDCKDRYRNGRDDSSAGGRYGSSNSSGRYDNGGRGNGSSGRNGDVPGNDTACVARCKRLRFSPHKQEQCVTDCDEYDGGSEKRLDFDTSEGDADEDDFPGNDTACVARCKRLRFSPHKQEQCITGCDDQEEGDSFAETSDFGTRNEEDGSNAGVPDFAGNTCKARCMRLRFGPQKQEDCLKSCPTNDFYARAA